VVASSLEYRQASSGRPGGAGVGTARAEAGDKVGLRGVAGRLGLSGLGSGS
jgi:hypothetical protein